MTNRMRLSTDGGCALCFGIGVCNGSEGPMVCPACGGDGHDRPTCRSCAGTGRNVADVPTGAIARFFGAAETKRRLVTCPTCKGSGKGWPRAEGSKDVTPRSRPIPKPRPKSADGDKLVPGAPCCPGEQLNRLWPLAYPSESPPDFPHTPDCPRRVPVPGNPECVRGEVRDG